jgi:quercetin dioxygenase-like cupin family protein
VSPPANRVRALAAGEGRALWFGANRVTITATGEDTDGSYGAWVTWAPPGSSPPLHTHRGVDEAFWIAEGRVRFRVGDRDFVLGPGGYALLPRDMPHTFIVEGPSDAVMFGMLSPGGSEQYFADAGRPARSEGLPPAGPPDMERLMRAGAAHGIAIVGPPLRRPEPAQLATASAR